ncbi:alpha-E domain-containing protein [Pontibacter harenae]|uniref:alpha-E domain-containing protein n=1 Tax=Pontibacter harenae TaxID=2894083 RepID=UPI001E504A7A|nr:alpha-E domain-containing protein [Pontibacter harenae]MCC9168931.1 alpha-E domain-containing protein [Pontibacter harenae]
MLSRVAESLYWISRYIERTDGMLRMLKINYAASQDAVSEFSWSPVIRIFCGPNWAGFNGSEFNSREVLLYMVTEKRNPNSIINIVTQVRENARSVQDHITKDVWQCLNEYYHTVKDPKLNAMLQKEDPISVLDILIKQGMLFYGTTEITMPRNEGSSFMRIGKYLERSIQSVNILDSKFGSVDHNPDLLTNATYWKHLLLSIGGYELYLKTYRQGFEAENVLEQVVLNKEFPRSVIYSLNHLNRYFERLKEDGQIYNAANLVFLIGRLQSKVKYSSTKGMKKGDLHIYLAEIKTELYSIGNAINQTCFNLS